MTGFEPRTSGIGSDRSTNWATTTVILHELLNWFLSPLFRVERWLEMLNKLRFILVCLLALKLTSPEGREGVAQEKSKG